jgi:hypothetical protein
MAQIDFLQSRGFRTGFVGLSGHTVATAETSVGRWIVLDPDVGVAIPYDLGTLTADRALLETYYARHLERHPWAMYTSATPTVTYGGALVRYPKACRIERLS